MEEWKDSFTPPQGTCAQFHWQWRAISASHVTEISKKCHNRKVIYGVYHSVPFAVFPLRLIKQIQNLFSNIIGRCLYELVPIQSLAVRVGDCREKFVKYIQFLAGYDRYMYERTDYNSKYVYHDFCWHVHIYVLLHSIAAVPYLFSLIQPAPPELNPVLPMLPPQKTFSARSWRRVIPYSRTFIIF